MLILSGVGKVKCSNCDTIFDVDAVDIDVTEAGSEERDAGEEIFYYGQVTLACPKCRRDIGITFEASEYPYGAENYREIEVEGGEFVEAFRRVVYERYRRFSSAGRSGQTKQRSASQTLYSFDEEIGLLLPQKPQIITNLQSGIVDLLAAIDRKPEILHGISDREFEELIAFVFSDKGFIVQLTKRTRDGGRDVIALRSDLGIPTKFLIECKRYAMHKKVGVGIVRELYGVHNHEAANKSIVVTTSRFTKDAKTFATDRVATEWALALKDYDDVREWVKDTSVNRQKK